MRSTCRLVVVLTIVITFAVGAAAATNGPQGVSPGAVDRLAAIEGRCPTFSWQEVADAAAYELVVYELAESATIEAAVNPEDAAEVLFASIPGGALSWTPEVAGCLAPGGRYAWYVRAVLDPASGEATEWSAPRLFTVSSAPTVQEVEQALTVLLRYVEEGSRADGPEERALTDLARSAAEKATRSVQTGTAAIRGEQPDPSGETYGVVGISASLDGAGAGVANTAGGPDLVLDGSADSLPDAELSQSGIDRPWGTPQTFDITNSMGSGMTLRVDGVDVVTTATDQDTPPRDPGNQLNLSGNTLDVVEGSGSGLDADSLDGQDSGAFAGSVHTHSGTDITTGTVADPRIASTIARDTEIMPTVLANDGSGSGLDADGLDGFDSTAFSPLVHLHDDRYYTETELNTSGAGGAVHWDNLASVPAGFADGVDDDTTYTPGPGTIIVGDQIRVNPFFVRDLSILETAGDVGQFSSVAFGVDGRGLISYFDATNQALKVAHCVDTPCNNASQTTLDSAGLAGQYSSVAIGTDGLGLISYYGNGDLKVAHCSNSLCLSATLSFLDVPGTGTVGTFTSLAIGTDGLGLVSYYGNGDLKVAHCNNTLCTSASLSTLESGVGHDSSVAIGTDGLGLISYYDWTNGDLKVAHCDNTLCTSATLSTLDSGGNVGHYTSLAIGADGLGLISYYDQSNGDLKVAHCNDTACTSAALSTVDNLGFVGADTSMAIGSDGLGLISYFDLSNSDLKVAHCNDIACTGATVATLDSVGDVGRDTAIAVRTDGVGLISYYDNTNDDHKVVYLPIAW